VFKTTKARPNLVELLPYIVFIVIFVVFLSGVRATAVSQEEEALQAVQESISRAILSCYAIEGRYPDNFEYLQKNYGLSIDEGKYVIFYQVFGTNIMPQVDVLVRREVR